MKIGAQLLLPLLLLTANVFAQTDFVPGFNTIFEDNFSRDPEGDFPARWTTNGDGQVVKLDDAEGKWLKITQPTAVTPNLKKSLPQNCTIEFDLFLKSTSGTPPFIMFGITSLAKVNAGIYKSNLIATRLYHYTDKQGAVLTIKNYSKVSEKKYALQGYVDRMLHVSISIDKTRWRVYLDGEKVTDMPQLLTPNVRKNFFIGSYTIIPDPEEGVYISNVRIAEGDAHARSLLIQQLMNEGSVVTGDIQFGQGNQLTQQSLPLVDQLGHTLQQYPDMKIAINGVEEVPATGNYLPGETPVTVNGNSIINKAALKKKADNIKAYLVNRFKIKGDRIVTGAKAKFTDGTAKSKTTGQAKQLLTEIIKL